MEWTWSNLNSAHAGSPLPGICFPLIPGHMDNSARPQYAGRIGSNPCPRGVLENPIAPTGALRSPIVQVSLRRGYRKAG